MTAFRDFIPAAPAEAINQAETYLAGVQSGATVKVPLSAGLKDQSFVDWWGASAGASGATNKAAIEDCMDATAPGGLVQFGVGEYAISGQINSTKPLRVRGISYSTQDNHVGATAISGNFSGYLFSFPLPGIVSGASLENLYLYNSHATGNGIYITNALAPTLFQNLVVIAYRGITIGASDVEPTSANFTVKIDNVRLQCSGAVFNPGPNTTTIPANSWGIYTRGHTEIVAADIVNFDHGIRIGGAQVSILGGRYEVNRVGIHLGSQEDGTLYNGADVSIVGFAMEANDIGIECRTAGNIMVSAFSIQGSTGSPSAQSQYGMKIDALSQGVFIGGGPGGSFAKAGIKLGSNVDATFIGVGASSDYSGAPDWDVATPQTSTFIKTNFTNAADVSPDTMFGTTAFVPSLAANDRLRGRRKGKNLRGIDVAVAQDATFKDIVFPTAVGGDAQINTATAVVDGASTLAAGTYYYRATILNEIGETTGSVEKTVVVTAGQRVDVTFFGGLSANSRRRVYRGVVPGVMDGVFDHTLESSATFADSGQAFTAKTAPSLSVEGAEGAEPDANYSVTVAPAWATTCWISAKDVDGFRVNFGTAPGSDSTLDWHLIR